MAKLQRILGLGATILFGIGSILGAGIYTIIGKVAGLSGNMLWLSFAIAFMTALFTAFSYAELSAAYPKSGGEYVYAERAFGKRFGFLLGLIVSMSGIVSGATVATGFAGYLSELIQIHVLLGSLGIISLLFFVNVSGIRESSTFNIIFTIVEAAGLVFIIFISLNALGKVNLLELPPGGVSGIFMGSALAFFAYIGFEEIVKLSEETRKPEQTIPRALFLASFIVLVMYMLVAVCVVSVMPYEKLAESQNPLALIAESAFGNTGLLLISVIALFATSNTILSNMLGSSRVFLNMAKETRPLKWFSSVSEKQKTPIHALILIFLIMCVFALIGDIEIIARIANIFIFITFIVVNLAVIVLRVKDKSLKRPYYIPLNFKGIPLVPVLGIAATLLLFGYNIYSLIGK